MKKIKKLLKELEHEFKAKCEQTIDKLENDDLAIKHGMIVTLRKDLNDKK